MKTAVATKIAQSSADAPAIIEVVTAQQIEAAGYRSVAEALARVPGLALNGDHVYTNVGVRGISGGLRGGARHIKVLIDGQPIAFRPDAQNFLGPELIPVNAIARIEILRGPASALYGLNAFLGVINIVPKTAASAGADAAGAGASAGLKQRAISAEGGRVVSSSSWSGEALFVDRIMDLEVTLAARLGYEDRSGLRLPQDGPNVADYSSTESSQNDLSRPMSYFGSASYDTGSIGKFTLTSSYQELDSRGEFVDYGAFSHRTRINLNNWFVRLRHEVDVGMLKVSTGAAYSGGGPLDGDVIQPVVAGEPLSYRVKRRFGYNAIDVGSEGRVEFFEKSSVLFGLEYTNDQERIRSNTFISNSTGLRTEGAESDTQAFTNVAGYVQALYREVDWLQLNGNLRYDTNNQFGSNVNYRAGAVLALGPDIRLKLLTGSSYRGPTPEQLYGTPVAPSDVQGSLSAVDSRPLKPQTALMHEVSLNHELKTELTTLRTQLNGYYMSIENRIEFLTEAGQFRPTNSARSRTIGGEFAVSVLQNQILDALSVACTGSVSYHNTEIDLNEDVLTPREVNRLGINEIYPTWMYKANLLVHAPRVHLRLHGQVAAYQDRLQSQTNQIYGRPFVDSKVHRLPASYPVDFTLSTAGVHLFGEEQETFLALSLKDAFNSQTSEPGFNGINLPPLGRRVYLSLRQDF